MVREGEKEWGEGVQLEGLRERGSARRRKTVTRIGSRVRAICSCLADGTRLELAVWRGEERLRRVAGALRAAEHATGALCECGLTRLESPDE